MLSAISFIFKLLEAIGLAGKVWEAIDELRYLKMKGDASKQFEKGEAQARKDGSTCELEKAFNPDVKCD